MRLLLFADLHLDAPFAWLAAAAPAAAAGRRRALRSVLRRIIELAVAERVDVVCCAGDLFEQDRFAADTPAFLADSFAAAGCPVLLAPGNHDWLAPSSPYLTTSWPGNVTVFTDDRLAPHELADGLTVWGAGHRAPANTDNFLAGFAADRGGVNLALIHGSERGGLAGEASGKAPHAPFHAAEVPAAGLTHALVGHFHSPVDGPWHTYPGNPDPLSFGESGTRGAVIIEVAADGSLIRSRRSVVVSRVHDVAVDLSGAAHLEEVRERLRATMRGLTGAVRATLSGELAAEVDLRPEELAAAPPEGVDALVVRASAVRPAFDAAAIAAEQTVRGQFVRDVLDADLDDDTRRRVLLTGLRALAGRDDLEVA